MNLLNENIIYITLLLGFFCFILFIICIVSLVKTANLTKRLNKFMQPSQDNDIEALLSEYAKEVKNTASLYDNVMSNIENLNTRIDNINSKILKCIQKVGVVRYNPFDDIGGDLSFAVAMLDENNDGLILNSIYSRDGCYIYAKYVLNGENETYKLSDEEKEAIKIAKEVKKS